MYAILWKSVFGLLLLFAGASGVSMSTYADNLSHEKDDSSVDAWPQCIAMTTWEDFLTAQKKGNGTSTPILDDRRDSHEGILILKNKCGKPVYDFRLELIETLKCVAQKDAPRIAVRLAETPPIIITPEEEVRVNYKGYATCQVCCRGRPFPGTAPQAYGKGNLGEPYNFLEVFTEDYHYRPAIIEDLTPQPDSSCGLHFEGHFISIKKMNGEIIWLNPLFPDHA